MELVFLLLKLKVLQLKQHEYSIFISHFVNLHIQRTRSLYNPVFYLYILSKCISTINFDT